MPTRKINVFWSAIDKEVERIASLTKVLSRPAICRCLMDAACEGVWTSRYLNRYVVPEEILKKAHEIGTHVTSEKLILELNTESLNRRFK